MIKESEKKPFTERVNYVIENGQYCAHTVNMPLIVQAESFEDMMEKIQNLAEVYLKQLTETIENSAFDFVEEEKPSK